MDSNKGTTRGSIIFYTFVVGCVIVAYVSGFYLGKEVERNEWKKRIEMAKAEIIVSVN